MSKKIVITGGAGYIGSILTEEALLQGYEVHVVDRFFFGNQDLDKKGAHLHNHDSRAMPVEILDGAYAVLDLAAISNDPAGELDPTATMDINFRARRRLQELCVIKGVERYVLASSCSVYGFQSNPVDEESEVNPLTTYAEANVLAEKSAFSLSGQGTAFTALRQATVFGLSPRMRFDLAINAMTLNVWKSGTLRVLRDGSQWRPMVHVRDTARAFLEVLKQPSELVANEIFNLGSNQGNYQILQMATLVSDALGKETEIEWYGDPDNRSYRVNFDKISKLLNFETNWTVESAAKEIANALSDGKTSDSIQTYTLDWYKTLSDWKGLLAGMSPESEPLF